MVAVLHAETSGWVPPCRNVMPVNPTMSASRPARVSSRGHCPRRRWADGVVGREGMDPVPGHSIVATGEGERLAREQALDDHDRLGQALDSGASGIEAQPSLVVFGLHVAGAEAELQPAVAQEIQGRRLARDQHGVAEVIVEDHGADAKILRGVGGGDERRDRRQEVGQVIRHGQHRVTEAERGGRYGATAAVVACRPCK